MKQSFPAPEISSRYSDELVRITSLPLDPTVIVTEGLVANVSLAEKNVNDICRTETKTLDILIDKLEGEGERLNPLYLDAIGDRRLLENLIHATEENGTDLIDYIKHSNRFSTISRWGGVHDKSGKVVIPESHDNLYSDGSLRREESGDRFDMDYIITQGIDPRFVLYFRATRPSSKPKPEYYWTSSFSEVINGLSVEGSNSNRDSIVLVSTLADIAKDEGLLIDVNDDSGIAVRQISIEPFDQREALCSFRIHDYESPSDI